MAEEEEEEEQMDDWKSLLVNIKVFGAQARVTLTDDTIIAVRRNS